MSARARSIEGVLKNIPFRRSRPTHTSRDREEPVADPETSVDAKDEDRRPKIRSRGGAAPTNDENLRGSDKPAESNPLTSGLQIRGAHEGAPPRERRPALSGGEDLINRLSRLHADSAKTEAKEEPHSDEDQEETHRATSRQAGAARRAASQQLRSTGGKSPANEPLTPEEYSDEEHSEERRKAPGRHRSSYSSKYDDVSEEEPEERPRHSSRVDSHEDGVRRSRGGRPRTEPRAKSPMRGRVQEDRHERKASRADDVSARRHSPTYNDDSDEEFSARPRGRRNHDASDDDVDSRYSAKYDNPDDREDDDDYGDSRRGKRSSLQNITSIAFSTLPKTAITRLSKAVGIGSMASDIYEPIKDLAGKFVHNIVSEAAKKYTNITSFELEPIVKKYLGHSEDLDTNEIKSATFAKWLMSVLNKYDVSMAREAVLYLHNSVELYIIYTLAGARETANRDGRTRVTSDDIRKSANRVNRSRNAFDDSASAGSRMR